MKKKTFSILGIVSLIIISFVSYKVIAKQNEKDFLESVDEWVKYGEIIEGKLKTEFDSNFKQAYVNLDILYVDLTYNDASEEETKKASVNVLDILKDEEMNYDVEVSIFDDSHMISSIEVSNKKLHKNVFTVSNLDTTVDDYMYRE